MTSNVLKLNAIHIKAQEIANFLMDTFFVDDTWNVRQGLTYGVMPIHTEEGEVDIATKEVFLIDLAKILNPERIKYYNEAYHFPDSLWAVRELSSDFFMGLMMERKNLSREAAALDRILEVTPILVKLLEESVQFLNTTALTAFTVKIDAESLTYTVEPITLSIEEIRAKFDELRQLIT